MDGDYGMPADLMFDTGLTEVRRAAMRLPPWVAEIAAGNISVHLDLAFPPVPDASALPPLERAAFFAHAPVPTRMATPGHDPGPLAWARSRLKQGGLPISLCSLPATGRTRTGGKHVCT